MEKSSETNPDDEIVAWVTLPRIKTILKSSRITEPVQPISTKKPELKIRSFLSISTHDDLLAKHNNFLLTYAEIKGADSDVAPFFVLGDWK